MEVILDLAGTTEDTILVQYIIIIKLIAKLKKIIFQILPRKTKTCKMIIIVF